MKMIRNTPKVIRLSVLLLGLLISSFSLYAVGYIKPKQVGEITLKINHLETKALTKDKRGTPLKEGVDESHSEENKQIACLALTIYGEARGESWDGMAAVAWSIHHRVNSRRFKNTYCAVVLQEYQYEALEKKSRLRWLVETIQAGTPVGLIPKAAQDKRAYDWAFKIAKYVYKGKISDPSNGATHFIALKTQEDLGRKIPGWVGALNQTSSVGGHTFFSY